MEVEASSLQQLSSENTIFITTYLQGVISGLLIVFSNRV